ncbi:abortive infection family protein [Actinophytocola sp. KF-1]
MITDVTRRAIFDELHLGSFRWAGRLEETEFLSRVYQLDELPSNDPRFEDAFGDIWQHRVNNLDWGRDWVFYDDRFGLLQDEEKFLQFIAATVHPVVRPDQDELEKMLFIYNRHLNPDGWEMVEVTRISGRPVFAARSMLTVPSSIRHVEKSIVAGDTVYLTRQITRMEAAIETDPELAIGTAKELVEAASVTVLEAMGVTVDKSWDLTRVVKEVGKRLKISPDEVKPGAVGEASIRKVLGSLAGAVAGTAELRNLYGTGHGKATSVSGLGPRHARLAAGAASTLAVFIFETYNQRTQR